MSTERPGFRKANKLCCNSNVGPFNKLPNRARSHVYLRQPQAGVLRKYQKQVNPADIARAFYGHGKDGCRLTGRGGEAPPDWWTSGLPAGTKETRECAVVGRYKTGNAVGISTYANIFNVKPVIQASKILVFYAAHGGEQFATDIWSVRVNA
jgi:hypothetical protein